MSKVPEFLPVFAPLTDKSEERINAVLSIVKQLPQRPQLLERTEKSGTTNKPTAENDERLLIYGFLSSRHWNVKKAAKMVTDAETLYKALHIYDYSYFPSPLSIRGYNQEDLIARLALPRRTVSADDVVGKTVRDCSRFVKMGVHYWDKRGLPVVYFMLGQLDVRVLYKEGRKVVPVGETLSDFVVRYLIYVTETMMSLCQYQDQILNEKPQPGIDKGGPRRNFVTLVVDAWGLDESVIYRPVLEVLQQVVLKLKGVTPDCIHRVLVVNSPPSIRFIYGIVKPLIDERMQKRIAFVPPEHTVEVLDRVIGLERVPDFLGGRCSCENGCLDGFVPGMPLTSTEECTDVGTEYIKLSAHEKLRRAFELTAGESVIWDFSSSKGVDVRFSVYFYRAQSGLSIKPGTKHVQFDKTVTPSKDEIRKASLVKFDKLTEGTDHFEAKENGFLELLWDNSKSWVQDKPIQMRVYKGNAPHTVDSGEDDQ